MNTAVVAKSACSIGFAAAPTAAAATVSPRTEATWRPARGTLTTPWTARVDPLNVLPEYPRPQMVRERWQNLNGVWELALLDDEDADAPVFGQALPERVLVPFPIESPLSGVMRRSSRAVYRRTFRALEMAAGERLLLHFGAVDWRTRVYLNGRAVGEHTGGYDGFSFDITDALNPGSIENELVVDVWDPTDAFGQPRGKQATVAEKGLFYTPVTGIWQTVWLEPVPAASIDRLWMTPDVPGSALRLTVHGRGTEEGQRVTAVAMAEGREVGRTEGTVGAEMRIPVPSPRLWGPDDPFLYDLRVTLDDGRETDRVDSYFGMRTVSLVKDEREHARIALNGEPWFHVGPLDQGWWPDGLYTAPTDEALRSDVERTKAAGFNFTRKHIKVEPARWYFHADRLGLPVWQDMPCGWNDTPEARAHFERELRAMIEGRGNHPSIIVWVPFNEKWGQPTVEWTREIVDAIKAADPTRLVDDASGWEHTGAGDIVDVHRYQGPQALVPHADKATVVGEFGGLGFPVSGHLWRESDRDNWGYGGAYASPEALHDRYDLLMQRMWRLRDTHGMSAAVYTQLTDVETEINGLFTYDRAVFKLDPDRVAAVNRGLAPLILPEHGEFTHSADVTVHQGTPTELRFTADGSEPTAESPLFAPLTIREDTTVRIRGFQDGQPTAAPEARMDYRRVPGRAADYVDVVPGVDYAYFADTSPEPRYRLDWPVRDRLSRIDAEPGDPELARTGTLPDVSLDPRDRDELFGFRFAGYVRVPADGVYTFSAVSKDGVALWIGGRALFWSMGQSPAATEDEGTIALRAGLHPFVLGYHQAYGVMALEIRVEGPGVPRQRIPETMLFRPAGAR
ncbi:MAG TPA: PA14 domain-containing protein [Longimicrobium sp.]|nr:PA14 domain-containing protein [Longimicrobium sp.]